MLDTDSLDDNQKNQLTFHLCQILENWQLSDAEQLNLLDLEGKVKPRHLYQYRRGDTSFEFDQGLKIRAEMVLGVYEALNTTYPTNRDYPAIWLRRSVRKFKNKAPLELMLSGEHGMKRVWHFLDCTQGWRD